MENLQEEISEISKKLKRNESGWGLTKYESLDIAVKLMQLKAFKDALMLDKPTIGGTAIPVLEKIAMQLGASSGINGRDINIIDAINDLMT